MDSPASSVPFTPLYINGQFVPSDDSQTFEVRNPMTGDIVGTSASATSTDCKAAIEAATLAFKTWERSLLTLRRDILLKAADLISGDKYKEKIVHAMEQETASALYWSTLTNWAVVPNFLRVQATLVDRLRGEIFPSGSVPGAQVISERRAMGVIFSIAPWNAPVVLALRAIAVPILCGNTVLLKGSELSPRSQSIVCELFEEAGLPAGVLNFISMSRENAPSLTAEVIAHPLVRSVNFTGSDRVGKIIAMEAAKHLKPCILELGGKAPAVVLRDANVQEAAKAIVFGAMAHSGQVCMSTERVIVHAEIADQLIQEVKTLCGPLKSGDLTTNSGARIGPLFSAGSADNIVNMLKEAQAAGAEVILGDLKNEGSIVQPHLLRDVKPGMRIWDRETFGPVIVFAVASSTDEAIELANASEYSLTASLWTSDLYKAQEIAARIRSGCTNINGLTMHSEPTDGLLGLGGASGYGRFHLENFTDKRVIVTHPLPGRQYPLFL